MTTSDSGGWEYSFQVYLVALGFGNFAASHGLWSIFMPSTVLWNYVHVSLQWSLSDLGHFLWFVCVCLQHSPVYLLQLLGIYHCIKHLYLLSGQHYPLTTVAKQSAFAQTCSWKFLEVMKTCVFILNKMNLHKKTFEQHEGYNFIKLPSVSSKPVSVSFQGSTCRQSQGPKDLNMIF